MELNNLPLVSAGGVQSTTWFGEIFNRNFPLTTLKDSRNCLVVVFRDIEVALIGIMRDYVLEEGTWESFKRRLTAAIRNAFHAVDESIPIPGPADYEEVVSNSTRCLVGLKDLLETEDATAVKLYTARVGAHVGHGIIMSYIQNDGLNTKRVQRGYINVDLVPHYDFDKWRTATLEAYQRYSEADGYSKMVRVVNNAEAAFRKSRAPKLGFVVHDGKVIVCNNTFKGFDLKDYSTYSPYVLHGHYDLCAGHPFMYAPMTVPVGGDKDSGAYSYNMDLAERGSHNGACTMLAFRQQETHVLASARTYTRFKDKLYGVPAFQASPGDFEKRLLKALMPDLRVVADLDGALSEAQLNDWHKQAIALSYRDSGEGAGAPTGMSEDQALQWVSQERKANVGRKNLTKMPDLVGNTLALYSYIAGEAMGDYETWNEAEFLNLLDDAFAPWQPTKDADAIAAINAFCDALGCPHVENTKYVFTDAAIF